MTDGTQALTEREKETLRLLVHGHDSKSIARALGLSVHKVNERLRASRRKLGVSSSREAARLLARAEGDTPKFLVPKPLGVAAVAQAPEKEDGRSGLTSSQRLTILALGGTLIMSLIIVAALLAWGSPQDTAPDRPARWSQVTVDPRIESEVRNVVRLDGNSLLWNGSPITETQLKQYLDIITQLSPQPVLVLSYSAQTKARRVEAIRSLIEDVLQCTPSNCREITLPPAQ